MPEHCRSPTLIEEANVRFKPIWVLNRKNYSCFESYCEVINKFMENNNAVAFSFEVDEITMQVSFDIECEEVVVQKKESMTLALIEPAAEVNFSQNTEEKLIVKLTFPSLWERIEERSGCNE